MSKLDYNKIANRMDRKVTIEAPPTIEVQTTSRPLQNNKKSSMTLEEPLISSPSSGLDLFQNALSSF